MGIIAHVWNDGEHNGFKRDSNIPSSSNKRAYSKYMKDHYDIPRDVIKNWRMKSQDIIAEVIRDTKSQAVAVIVFESQQDAFLDEGTVKSVYNDSMRRKVIGLLDKLHEQRTPSVALAEEAQL